MDLATDLNVTLHIRASSYQFLAKITMDEYIVSRHHLQWSIWICDDMFRSGQYHCRQVDEIRQNAVRVLLQQL